MFPRQKTLYLPMSGGVGSSCINNFFTLHRCMIDLLPLQQFTGNELKEVGQSGKRRYGCTPALYVQHLIITLMLTNLDTSALCQVTIENTRLVTMMSQPNYIEVLMLQQLLLILLLFSRLQTGLGSTGCSVAEKLQPFYEQT